MRVITKTSTHTPTHKFMKKTLSLQLSARRWLPNTVSYKHYILTYKDISCILRARNCVPRNQEHRKHINH